MPEPIDPQITAEARIAVLTELVSDLLNRLIFWQTTAQAMALSREREQGKTEQGTAVA